jgi:hypothetical protein
MHVYAVFVQYIGGKTITSSFRILTGEQPIVSTNQAQTGNLKQKKLASSRLRLVAPCPVFLQVKSPRSLQVIWSED